MVLDHATTQLIFTPDAYHPANSAGTLKSMDPVEFKKHVHHARLSPHRLSQSYIPRLRMNPSRYSESSYSTYESLGFLQPYAIDFNFEAHQLPGEYPPSLSSHHTYLRFTSLLPFLPITRLHPIHLVSSPPEMNHFGIRL